jgi:hypothetical protein
MSPELWLVAAHDGRDTVAAEVSLSVPGTTAAVIIFYAYLNGNPEFVNDTLTSEWREALKSLSQHPETLGHPILTLFPQEVTLPLEDLIRLRCRSRCSLWRQLDGECAAKRLRSWQYECYTLFGLRDVATPTTVMFDVFLDLLKGVPE